MSYKFEEFLKGLVVIHVEASWFQKATKLIKMLKQSCSRLQISNKH
jgi:hypothetical protein